MLDGKPPGEVGTCHVLQSIGVKGTDQEPKAGGSGPPSFELAVFGLGHVGLALHDEALNRGWEAAGFSRSSSLGGGCRVDAEQPESIARLAERTRDARFDALVVTFPPTEVHPSFWDLLESLSSRRILLGSTSIYRRSGPGRSRITEETPLKDDHDRLEAESDFLQRGGRIVRLSGIYGGSRNPVRWLNQGRVGYENRQVNLVHRDDIARALVRLLSHDRPQRVYNLSDGQQHTWRQIVDRLVGEGLLDHPRKPEPLRREDGFVENRLFLAEFPDFRFRDFWRELLRLAQQA